MVFNVIESARRKLDGTLEGETFDDIFRNVAASFNLHASDLQTFCEVSKDSNLRYTILSGKHKIAVLEPSFD